MVCSSKHFLSKDIDISFMVETRLNINDGGSENINILDLTIQVKESFTPMQIEDFV